MIRHTVVFKLKHAPGSREETDFLDAFAKLSEISTAQNLEILRQISKKNSYSFGASMEFASDEDYQFYNNHPSHTTFVENRWIPEVTDFMEIDYEPL